MMLFAVESEKLYNSLKQGIHIEKSAPKSSLYPLPCIITRVLTLGSSAHQSAVNALLMLVGKVL
jgi:hypothetical protein